MLEQMAEDYAAYFKVDVLTGFRTVQDVVDNMLTRLEELTSVLQIIKLKDNDCSLALSEDIIKYRSEITVLCKKITTLINVIAKLQTNVDLLEKQVEKAEADFGITNENKLKSLFKPFLRKKDNIPPIQPGQYETLHFESVMTSFENND